MRKRVWSMVAASLLVWNFYSFAAQPTTQVDALIKKLIEKGILTEKEADEIKGEIVSDEKSLREASNKTDIPQWVQDTKLKGDFRLRHEFSHRNDGTDVDRNRGRIRYRLGLETKANDKVLIGIGLASNGGPGTTNTGTAVTTDATNFSPRANNESFQNVFSKQPVVLNYAYAQYMPNDKLTLIGGKMLNPIWEPWEFLWDNDITPEGGAMQFNYPLLGDKLKLVSTLTAFQIQEISGNEADPFMFVGQAGFQGKASEKGDYKILGSVYNTDNITKTLLNNRASTASNTLNPSLSSQYAYHYNTYGVGMDVGLNDPLGKNLSLYFPRIGVFGEYMVNPDPPDKNTAWMAGGYLGNSKVSGWGTWKMIGAYKSIGQDAFLDTFPDSDFYSGSTDVQGYEMALELGLAKNVSFSIDYYRTGRIKTTHAQESVVQTDINFKF